MVRASLAVALTVMLAPAVAPAARWQASLPASGTPAAAFAAIDALVAREFGRDGVGSITVGVVADGRLAWTRSYGMADMEAKVPASRESVYRIGSITKQFTGLMLLQLVERGTVGLSDPVEKYFPEVNLVRGRLPDAPPITLVQLATMTSGLGREPEDLPTCLAGPVRDWEQVLIAALPRTKYDHEPGTRYLYSNIGYAILGAALARAAGQPFTEYVQQRIFEPFGMTHTAFEPNEAIRSRIAKGYAVRRAGPTGAPGASTPAPAVDAETPAREHEGRGYKVPNGAMYTTIDDLAKFVAFELGADVPAVLKKATWDDAVSRVYSSDGSLRSGYGLGFQLTRRGDQLIVGHGGSVAGYTAAAHVDRAAGAGVIVLRSAGGGGVNAGALAMQALEILAGKAPHQPADSGDGGRRELPW
jgi:CubicO group peptidase (beta-lactamase class C family)